MEFKINSVTWFEIPVNDMGRAKKFYESVFGKPMTVQTKGAVEMALFPKQDNAYGAGGSLIKVAGYKPSRDGTLVYFPVETIEPVLEKVHAASGKTLKEKMAIGEYGFIAHFEDSEGNRLGLHQWK